MMPRPTQRPNTRVLPPSYLPSLRYQLLHTSYMYCCAHFYVVHTMHYILSKAALHLSLCMPPPEHEHTTRLRHHWHVACLCLLSILSCQGHWAHPCFLQTHPNTFNAKVQKSKLWNKGTNATCSSAIHNVPHSCVLPVFTILIDVQTIVRRKLRPRAFLLRPTSGTFSGALMAYHVPRGFIAWDLRHAKRWPHNALPPPGEIIANDTQIWYASKSHTKSPIVLSNTGYTA